MPEITRDEIVEGIHEFLHTARDAEKKKRYKAAITLYYKALIACTDFLVFSKENIVPRNHRHRFRLLKKHYKELYRPASDLFNIYRLTYNRAVTKAEMQSVKKGVIQIIRATELLDYLKQKIRKFEETYF